MIVTAKIPEMVDYCQRIETLIHLKMLDQAVAEARRALADEPENAKVHQLLAWALRKQGKLPKAESHAKVALGLAPHNADVHSTLALILTDRKKFRKAKLHHEQAIELAPRVAIFYTRYGLYFLRKRRGKMALEKANEALRLAPHQVEALLVRADALRFILHLPEAEDSAREALALAPSNANAHYVLGHIQFAQGRDNEAIANFREALRLESTDRAVKRDLIHAVLSKYTILGRVWRRAHTSCAWRILPTILVLSCFYAGCYLSLAINEKLVPIFLAFFLLFPLIGALLFRLLDPVITYALFKGWIKLEG